MARAKSWDDLPLLLSVPEVQDAIGLSKHHAYSVANDIGIRVGKRLLVPKDALRSWMNKSATTAPRVVNLRGR